MSRTPLTNGAWPLEDGEDRPVELGRTVVDVDRSAEAAAVWRAERL